MSRAVKDDLNMHLSLAQVASVLNVDLIGEDCEFSQVSINTRTLETSDLFVAIKGENFDAHDYVQQAEDRGACGLVVEKPVDSTLPQIIVADSRIALGNIASLWSSAFTLPIIAVTGSCGKTTVKEMTAAILQAAFCEDDQECILATQGNLNNDIGVPLTLLRLNKAHKAAVIEMGANHIGEIKQLVDIVQPDVAVITNVTLAHIEGFGSLDGVAQAKGEIYSGIEQGGTAVINTDDVYASYWEGLCDKLDKSLKQVRFGINHSAEISAQVLTQVTTTQQEKITGQEIVINTPQGQLTVCLPQPGLHNVYNALASTAASLAVEVSLQAVKTGLEGFTNISGRLEQKTGINSSRLFDDTYNANPGSVRAGIEAIKQVKGKHVLVLGDMGELGAEAEALHYELGQDAFRLGIDSLFTIGSLTEATYKGFIDAGADTRQAQYFTDRNDLTNELKKVLQSEHVVLIKGSRTMKMEEIVAALEKDAQLQAESDTHHKEGTQ